MSTIEIFAVYDFLSQSTPISFHTEGLVPFVSLSKTYHSSTSAHLKICLLDLHTPIRIPSSPLQFRGKTRQKGFCPKALNFFLRKAIVRDKKELEKPAK